MFPRMIWSVGRSCVVLMSFMNMGKVFGHH